MSEKSTLKHINVIIHSIIYLLSLKMQWSQRTRERSVNSEIPGSLPSLFPQLSLSKFWTLFFCPGVPTNTAGTYDTAGTSQSHCQNLSHCPLAMSSTPPHHHHHPLPHPRAKSLQPQVLSAQDPGTRGMENKAPPSTPQVQHPLLLPSLPHPCLGLVLQITTQPFRAWQGPLRCLIQMAHPVNRK